MEASKEEKAETIARFGEGRRRYLEVAEKEQLTILQWFQQLLEEQDEYVIIYRPHPGDASPRAEALAEKYENFKVISELSVKQWIAVSDMVYAWNSTAILEAFFAGKNPMYLCPYPIPEDQDHPLLMKMNKIIDYETFCKTVSGEQVDIGLTKELVNPFYLVDDERASYLKIADAFEEVYQDAGYALDKNQLRAYWRLYSRKERAIILFMRMTFLYKIYSWMLENVPLSFIQKRRQWLEKYQAKEYDKWEKMNAIEAEDSKKIEAIEAKIKALLEG